MHFQVIKDDFYENILEILVKMVPEYYSAFDFSYGAYLILGGFGSFILENRDNSGLIDKCFAFINTSLNQGGHKTEEVMIDQIFPVLNQDSRIRQISRDKLDGKAIDLFENFLKGN
jgi:hypothetical protein